MGKLAHDRARNVDLDTQVYEINVLVGSVE